MLLPDLRTRVGELRTTSVVRAQFCVSEIFKCSAVKMTSLLV